MKNNSLQEKELLETSLNEKEEDSQENEEVEEKEEEEKYEIERNLKFESPYDTSLKVILLGDSMVGKSCLINRLCRGIFDETLGPTITIEYFNYLVKINNYIIRMQIWDTAGQEKFNAIIKNYYQNTDIGIYIYSIDNLKSFERIKDWMNYSRENNPKAETNEVKNILLGNKKDLGDEKRKVSYSDAENFATNNKFLVFREISCKDDNEEEINNILEVFDEIAKNYYDDFKKRRSSTLDSESLTYVASKSMMDMMEISHKKNNKKEKKKTKKNCC